MARVIGLQETIFFSHQMQNLTDASVKRFPSELERSRAYSQRITNLATRGTETAAPYLGEPTEIYSGPGGDWRGVDVWTGRDWKPLRVPTLDMDGNPATGLIRAEIDDAFTVAEPLGPIPSRATFEVTLYGDPRSLVTIAYVAEDHDPRPFDQRVGENPDPGGTTPGLDFEMTRGDIIFNPHLTETELRAAGWSERILIQGVPTRTYEIVVGIYASVGAESIERFQVRLFDEVNVRVDRNRGVGFLAPSTLPVIRLLDTTVTLENLPSTAEGTMTRATRGSVRWESNVPLPRTFEVVTNFAGKGPGEARVGGLTGELGVDLIPDFTSPFVLPRGASSGVIANFDVPSQPAETTETLAFVANRRQFPADPARNLTAILADRYALITLEGTVPGSRIVSDGIAVGDLYGGPRLTAADRSHPIEVPFSVIPISSGEGDSVLEWWTESIPGIREGNVQDTVSYYPQVEYANRNTIRIADGQASGTIRVLTRFFRTLNMALEPGNAEFGFNVVLANLSGPILTVGHKFNAGGIRGEIDVAKIQVEQGRIGTGLTDTRTPQVTIFADGTGTGLEGRPGRFRVEIDIAPPSDPASVQVTPIASGTAQPDVNFMRGSHTVRWAVGDGDPKFVEIPTFDTMAGSGARFDFTAGLSGEVGCTIAPGTARWTIVGTGPAAPGAVRIDLPAARVERAPGVGTRIITVNAATNRPLTGTVGVAVTGAPAPFDAQEGVHYRITADPLTGYTGLNTTLTWANDALQKPIQIQLLASGATEEKRIFVRLITPTNEAILGRDELLLRILPAAVVRPPPPEPPAVHISDASGHEGAGTNDLVPVVTLRDDPPGGATASIDLATLAGGARPRDDYGLPHGSPAGITWTQGADGNLTGVLSMTEAGTYPIRIGIIRSDIVKPQREFQLRASNAQNCRVTGSRARGTATMRIFADRPIDVPTPPPPPEPPGPGEPPPPPPAPVLPLVSAAAGSFVPATNQMVVRVFIPSAVASDITGRWVTQNGPTAIAGREFTSQNRIWRIPAGQTSTLLTVPLLRNAQGVSPKTFFVQLSGVSSNARTTTASLRSTCVIPAAAAPPTPPPVANPLVRLTAGTLITARGQTQQFIITRSGTPAQLALVSTVRFFTLTTKGSGRADITRVSRVIRFTAGQTRQTASVRTDAPTSPQGIEIYYVGLDTPNNCVIASGSSELAISLPATPVLPVVTIPTTFSVPNRGTAANRYQGTPPASRDIPIQWVSGDPQRVSVRASTSIALGSTATQGPVFTGRDVVAGGFRGGWDFYRIISEEYFLGEPDPVTGGLGIGINVNIPSPISDQPVETFIVRIHRPVGCTILNDTCVVTLPAFTVPAPDFGLIIGRGADGFYRASGGGAYLTRWRYRWRGRDKVTGNSIPITFGPNNPAYDQSTGYSAWYSTPLTSATPGYNDADVAGTGIAFNTASAQALADNLGTTIANLELGVEGEAQGPRGSTPSTVYIDLLV